MTYIYFKCDFCGKTYDKEESCSAQQLMQTFANLRHIAEKQDYWVYNKYNKRWYCPECAELRNAYEGERAHLNRDNMEGWHYTELNDFPPIVRDGLTDTVIDQDGEEVWFSMRLGWCKENEMSLKKVYKWKYKN